MTEQRGYTMNGNYRKQHYRSYCRQELFALGLCVQHDARLKTIMPATVKKVRRFRLNKRGRRGGSSRADRRSKASSPNFTNLIKVPIKQTILRDDKKVKVSTNCKKL